MRASIIAGSVTITFTFLSGCSSDTAQPVQIAPASASVKTYDCTLGTIDPERSFIRCANGRGRATDAMQAMNRPVDPAMSIASIAAEYGLAPQALTSITAGQSARVVTTSREPRPRDAVGQGPVVRINGRTFRKVILDATGREPTTLFIEG